MKKLIFIIGLLILPNISYAAIPAMTLYETCKSYDKQSKAADVMCASYIQGWFDGITYGNLDAMFRLAGLSEPPKGYAPLCMPDNVTGTQEILIFNKYAENHPEKLNDEAGSLLYSAITSAFCKSKDKK